jgi:hypothetical protein
MAARSSHWSNGNPKRPPRVQKSPSAADNCGVETASGRSGRPSSVTSTRKLRWRGSLQKRLVASEGDEHNVTYDIRIGREIGKRACGRAARSDAPHCLDS